MTTKRSAEFSLDEALRDPGFTPRKGDLAALFERAGGDEEDLARAACSALLRVEAPVLRRLVEHADAIEPRRSALLDLVGRACLRAGEPSDDMAAAVDLLARSLATGGHAAREAATAMSKVFGDDGAKGRALEAVEAGVEALVTASSAPGVDVGTQRAIARALAAAGTARARRALAQLGSGDHDGDKVIVRARIAAARDDAREGATSQMLPLDRPPGSALRAVLACRPGLENVVKEQLAASGRASRAGRPGRVDLELREAPAFVLGAARSALGIAFPLDAVELRGSSPEEIGEVVASALAAEPAMQIFRAFDREPIRFRVSFAGGGKHRATAWSIAERVAARSSGALVNDPRGAPWDIALALPPRDDGAASRRGERAPFLQMELRPRFDDARFPWRRADVPAASHPTIAAAIALIGGAERGDVVWDPFVGSGGELCERARLGQARRWIGTDVSEDALRAAALNTEAAGIAAELVLVDARAFDPGEPVTLILSNPPMGRRVLRHRGDVETLLASFVGRAARLLAPAGRLVWASAHPRETREAAQAAHLKLTDAFTVDLGGFDVELQRFEKL